MSVMLRPFYFAQLSLVSVICVVLGPVSQGGAQTPSQTPGLLPSPAPSMCRIADKALLEASAIRGLTPKKEVPCLVQGRTEIGQFLRDTIAEQLPPNKLKMEEQVYKAIGFIPDSFDYVNGIIALYVSQIGGYYDPTTHHFVMADWMPAVLQETVAVHELTHSLQDQYYDLDKILDPHLPNGDELLARSALIEGDATAVMIDQESKVAGEGSLASRDDIDALILQQVLGSGLSGDAGDTPPSLKAIVLFPYVSGLRFVHTLLKQHGYRELDRAFVQLPKSSREILHPEIYLAGAKDTVIVAPSELVPVLGEGIQAGEPSYTDTIGEFGISALFAAHLSDRSKGAEVARGWLGDLIGVFPSKQGASIAWKIVWESDADAKEFTDAYREAMTKTFGKVIGTGKVALTSQKQITIEQKGRAVTIGIEIQT